MHISGTPPSLPINCLYVCLVPILASGICFVHSSRHLVCIIARHTAFGDICQQHRESSFLLIFRAFFMLPVATPDVGFGVCVGNGMLTAVFDKYFLENISFNFFIIYPLALSILFHCIPCINAGRKKVHFCDFHL